jgi:hypothetical protein
VMMKSYEKSRCCLFVCLLADAMTRCMCEMVVVAYNKGVCL